MWINKHIQVQIVHLVAKVQRNRGVVMEKGKRISLGKSMHMRGRLGMRLDSTVCVWGGVGWGGELPGQEKPVTVSTLSLYNDNNKSILPFCFYCIFHIFFLISQFNLWAHSLSLSHTHFNSFCLFYQLVWQIGRILFTISYCF